MSMFFVTSPTRWSALVSLPGRRARCGRPTRWDLCGGLWATSVPTATPSKIDDLVKSRFYPVFVIPAEEEIFKG